MRYPDDGDPFNAGWNACLDEVIERVKKLPTEGCVGVFVLISKRDVLDLLNGVGQSSS